MVSEAFRNEVGVHRLVSLLGLSPDCCSAQNVLLQLALKPRCPRGSFLAFVVMASLHGVLRRVARLWRSPSWHLRRGLLPVARALAELPLVVLPSSFGRQRDRIRLSPRRGSSCSSSLPLVIPRGHL